MESMHSAFLLLQASLLPPSDPDYLILRHNYFKNVTVDIVMRYMVDVHVPGFQRMVEPHGVYLQGSCLTKDLGTRRAQIYTKLRAGVEGSALSFTAPLVPLLTKSKKLAFFRLWIPNRRARL